MTLSEMKENVWCKVIKIKTGKGITRRLQALGFGEGSRLRIVRTSPLKKSFLLEGTARISLSKEYADFVEVELCE